MRITLTAQHRHNGQWHDAGTTLDVDAATASLLIAAGKANSPDKAEAGVTGAQITPALPAKKKELSGFSPTTEGIE